MQHKSSYDLSERITRDQSCLMTAMIFSLRSTCQRKKVGAVLTLEGRILSTGYAGAPSGLKHCMPEMCDLTKPCLRTVHAEANAIAFAARYGVPINRGHLYCTLSPCLDCAKLIINSGIIAVTFYEKYRDEAPLDLLRAVGISVQQLSLPEFLYGKSDLTAAESEMYPL